jgi:hypothetical protein
MVNTQIIKDNSALVPEVLSNEHGWIVVYAEENDSPGEVLGFSPVFMVFNVDVFVTINPEKKPAFCHAT